MSLHTTTYGETGSRVLFLHGLFGQGRNWTQIARTLSAEHRVTLVDLPHHGRSPWHADFRYPTMADEVAAGLAEPVTLVGHSMGGKVAMLLALRRPELVERLCVVDMAPVDYANGRDFGGYVEAMQALDLTTLRSREDADRALAASVTQPTVRAFLLQNLRREGEGWRWQMNLEVLGRDLPVIGGWPAEELAGLTYPGPVLWVAGEQSGYVRAEDAATMKRWFPNTRKVTIKGAGHWVHSERPEVFVDVLRGFLSAD